MTSIKLGQQEQEFVRAHLAAVRAGESARQTIEAFLACVVERAGGQGQYRLSADAAELIQAEAAAAKGN